MKTRKNYEAPLLEQLSVDVEQGFTISGQDFSKGEEDFWPSATSYDSDYQSY